MQLFSMSLNLGYEGESLCVFCRRFIESRDCLFFECSFSKRLVFNNIAEVFLEESYLAMGCVNSLRGRNMISVIWRVAWVALFSMYA